MFRCTSILEPRAAPRGATLTAAACAVAAALVPFVVRYRDASLPPSYAPLAVGLDVADLFHWYKMAVTCACALVAALSGGLWLCHAGWRYLPRRALAVAALLAA